MPILPVAECTAESPARRGDRHLDRVAPVPPLGVFAEALRSPSATASAVPGRAGRRGAPVVPRRRRGRAVDRHVGSRDGSRPVVTACHCPGPAGRGNGKQLHPRGESVLRDRAREYVLRAMTVPCTPLTVPVSLRPSPRSNDDVDGLRASGVDRRTCRDEAFDLVRHVVEHLLAERIRGQRAAAPLRRPEIRGRHSRQPRFEHAVAEVPLCQRVEFDVESVHDAFVQLGDSYAEALPQKALARDEPGTRRGRRGRRP